MYKIVWFLASSCCGDARKLFDEVREGYAKLAKIVPKDEYYRYNDHWRYVTQRLSFLIALTIYLEVGMLVSRETVAGILGGKYKRKLPNDWFTTLKIPDYPKLSWISKFFTFVLSKIIVLNSYLKKLICLY